MAISPFQAPLDRERDPDAWVGGVRRKPTWTRRGGLIDRAGFHALLRAAQLPLAELKHMGADNDMLKVYKTGKPIEESSAQMLLGRIAWDAEQGNNGVVWVDHKIQRRSAERYGRRVIERWFKS